METIRFINKIYSDPLQNTEKKKCIAFNYNKIYFEINEDYYNLSIELAKKIFIGRYLKNNNYINNYENFFNQYFNIDKISISKDMIFKENDTLLVSSMQILFDKLYYIDSSSSSNP